MQNAKQNETKQAEQTLPTTREEDSSFDDEATA